MFTNTERFVRVTVMVIAIIVVLMDLFVWRPQ
jgi:phosphotransferase system  glucose/maltose/N-acetylglucosamine-specific IIC component